MNKKQNYIIRISSIIAVAILSLSLIIVLAQPNNTFTISSGIYPNAPNYTIWRDGSEYFAKDAYGQIDYSGVNATEVINNAIQVLPSSPYNKGKIYFADGIYELNGSIRPKSGTELCGAGLGSQLRANGNYSVIYIYGVGYNFIHDLAIRGYSNTSLGAYGIYIEYGSKITLSYLWISRSRAGIYTNGVFQLYADHIRIEGEGIDRNYNGIETHWKNSTWINEIGVTETLILQPINVGVRLHGASGCFFSGVSVINSGNVAWHIGDESAGQYSQYLHFDYIWADSPIYGSYAGFFFKKGSADSLHTIQMDNIWIGGHMYGLVLEDISDIILNNLYIKDINRNSIDIQGCNRTTINGGEVWGWDRGDTAVYSGAYVYGGSLDVIIDGTTFYNTNVGAYSIYVNGATRTQISDVNAYNAENIIDSGTDTRVTNSWNFTNWISAYP